MHVKVDWQKPIQLTMFKKLVIEEKDLLATVEARPGIYFFSRRHENTFVPFYIGETTDIKARLKTHWHSAKIQFVLRGMEDHTLKEIKGGARYFHFGYLVNKPADPKRHLRIAQEYLIRRALDVGCTLINKNLTKISVHTFDFAGSGVGRAIYPKWGKIEA